MLNLFRRWYERHFSQPGTIEFALVLICAFLIVYYLMWLVGPIVVALCIAFCLDWPVQALEKYLNLGRRLATCIVMFLFCSIVILITVLVVPQIVKQGAEFYNSIVSFSLEAGQPKDTANLNAVLNANNQHNLDVKQNSETVSTDTLQAAAINHTRVQPSSTLPPEVQHNQTTSTTQISTAASENNQSLSLAASKISKGNANVTGQTLNAETSTLHSMQNSVPNNADYDNKAAYAGENAKLIHTADPAYALSSSNDADSTYTNRSVSDTNTAYAVSNAADHTYAENNVNYANTIHSVNHQLAAQSANNKEDPAIIKLTSAVDEKLTQNQDTKQLKVRIQEAAELYTQENMPNPSSLIRSSLPKSILQELEQDAEEDDTMAFKLTVSDFDSRLAHEAYLVLMQLPEPLPSMLSMDILKNGVRYVRMQLTVYLADVMRTKLMPSVVNIFTWAVYLIIVPIFTFLMLYNKDILKKRATLFILPNNQVLMRKFWPSLHQQIAGYIRGKLLHIIIISIANSIAFKLLNVNYAMLLGVGVGLSVVIPYVGAVIIAIPVVLVAIFQFGFSESLIWVLVIYTVIQLLDSNVLTPMLFSKAMNLDAFSILAAILIFGGLWGFWGVFFAIPLATFIKTIVMQWPNKDVREQQKREHMRLIHEKKSELAKSPRV